MPSKLLFNAQNVCLWLLGLCFAFVLAGCGTIVQPWGPTTTVAALPGEDLAGPCRYQMHLAANTAPNGQVPPPLTQAGVLVIYERSDSSALYDDPKVLAMAQQLHFATMFAYQCDAKSFNDIQYDASKGPGRALFQALNQFAGITGHTELANANVVLSGFSAAGYLSLTMANLYPQRVLGLVLYAPASSHADVSVFPVSPAAAQIPTLVLASGGDTSAGTHRPLVLFQHEWSMGAPWGFGVQKNVGHCCNDSIAPLMIPWVAAVVQGTTVASAAGTVATQSQAVAVQPTVQFTCDAVPRFDVFGWQNCEIGDPSLVTSAAPPSLQPAWLPDTATAQAWLTWVTNSGSN